MEFHRGFLRREQIRLILQVRRFFLIFSILNHPNFNHDGFISTPVSHICNVFFN